MVDLHYTDPNLVALYDVFNGWSIDRDFYANLAGATPIRVLEVGCGTGLIARAIAEQGHAVTGLDPAQPMLDFAAAAPGGDRVDWVCGTLDGYSDPDQFHLIYMTGHAFQCLLTDEDITAFFEAAHRLLHRDGRLAFETRNPAAKAWEGWVPDKSKRTMQLPDGRNVTEWHALDNVSPNTVSFRSIYQFPDKRLTSSSILRFTNLQELEGFAQRINLQITETFGNWDRPRYRQPAQRSS